MKATLESTEKIVNLKMPRGEGSDEMPARIWEGVTESGIKFHAFIVRVAIDVDDENANAQFQRELRECRAPSPEIADAYPLRLVL